MSTLQPLSFSSNFQLSVRYRCYYKISQWDYGRIKGYSTGADITISQWDYGRIKNYGMYTQINAAFLFLNDSLFRLVVPLWAEEHETG